MNIKDILNELINTLKDSAIDKGEEAKKLALEYVADTEQRLLLLTTEATTVGGIDQTFFAERIKDELKILESQLRSFEVISESFAQETINSTVQNLLIILIGLIPKPEAEA